MLYRIRAADEWFKYFNAVEHKLPRRSSKDGPIKIGVLDTGVDLTNSWMASKRGRIRCWPEKTDCHDNDGHGTHVAHLLLRLTKNTQLHVCKIAESTYIKHADIQKTADVSMKHATPFVLYLAVANRPF